MATHDYIIDNASGASVRSDLNGALAAIATNNSADSLVDTHAFQWWADTNSGILKLRNSDDTGWVSVGTMSADNLGLLSVGDIQSIGIASTTSAVGASLGVVDFGNSTDSTIVSVGGVSDGTTTAGLLSFKTTGVTGTITERMCIKGTGKVGIGTNAPASLLHVKEDSSVSECLKLENTNTTSTEATTVSFVRNSTDVGSIKTSATSTIYATSSDYRLKEDVIPISEAKELVKALKPCNFNWISSGANVNGFLAHELAEVIPEAVHGTKDAMKEEVYEVSPANGTQPAVSDTRSVPEYQGIDQSKIVPVLTAAIQEMLEEIKELTARIESLEE